MVQVPKESRLKKSRVSGVLPRRYCLVRCELNSAATAALADGKLIALEKNALGFGMNKHLNLRDLDQASVVGSSIQLRISFFFFRLRVFMFRVL